MDWMNVVFVITLSGICLENILFAIDHGISKVVTQGNITLAKPNDRSTDFEVRYRSIP